LLRIFRKHKIPCGIHGEGKNAEYAVSALRRWPWNVIVGIKWVPPCSQDDRHTPPDNTPNSEDPNIDNPKTLCCTYDTFGTLLHSLLDSARGVSTVDDSASDGGSTSTSTRMSPSDITTIADFYLTTFCDFDHWADNILISKVLEEQKVSVDGITVRDIAKQGLAAFKRHKLIPIAALVDFLYPFTYDPKRFLDRMQRITLDGREARKAFTDEEEKTATD
jgi:hypothetical protein